MPWLVIVLPFAATLFIILIEGLFSLLKVRFGRLVMLVIGLAALLTEIWQIWQPGINTADGVFQFSPLARLFLSLLLGLAALTLILAYATANLNTRRFAPTLLGVCGALVVALYLTNLFLVTLFFVLAGLISIVAAVDISTDEEERFVKAVKAAVRYLIANVLFGLTLFLALIYLERLRIDPQLTGLIKVAVALVVVSFGLRLAIFPLGLWLPALLEEAPGLAGFIIIGLINLAAVIFLVDFLLDNPALIYDNYRIAQPVMIFGLSGAVLSGLLAIGQNGLGKMLAYTAGGDFGFILFGLASPHRTGLTGSLFEVANFALAHLLIFGSLAVVYYCNGGYAPASLTGLARRMPVAAVGVAVGFMAMVGAPFFSGFTGKYLLLQAAAQEGIWWVLAGGIACVFFAIAYLRFFHTVFLGAEVPGLKTLPEPRLAVIVILSLVIVTIVIGCWSAPFLSWIDTALKASAS